MNGFTLTVDDDRLVLRDLENPRMKPLACDFLAPSLQYRIRTGLSKREPMARAVGLDRGHPSIFDATAGLGIDAFLLAHAGCQVRSVERSEIVYRLLEDGYRRLRENGSAVAERLSFEHGDSIEILGMLPVAPDVVYLDPMYPSEGHSSALPKKGMQIFRRLIGEDLDVDRLIEAARSSGAGRVVVKRPVDAPGLAGVRTSFAGKTARWDVF